MKSDASSTRSLTSWGVSTFGFDWVDNPDKHTSRRVQILAHNLQNAPSVEFARELHVEAPDL